MNTATASTTTQEARSAPPWRPWPFRTPKWRQAIRESELPSPIQALLIETIGGTGLMADEKLEVAEELIAHFQDGLQRGRCVSPLIEDFGDPHLAAKLIHNGKLRIRSMKNRLMQALFLLGVLCGGGSLALMTAFYVVNPQPSTDYLAAINQPALAASDDEKAWTIYRDLWIKHEFGEGRGSHLPEIFQRDESGEITEGLLGPSDGAAWHKAKKKLESLADLLEGFRIGGLRPSFGVPLYIDTTQYSEADFQALFPGRDAKDDMAKQSNQDSLVGGTLRSIRLPHLQSMRQAARLLVVDTRWAIEQEDLERATRNIEAILGISLQVTDIKFLLASTVGLHLHSIALDLTEECLRANVGFSEQQLSRIQTAISKARIEDMIHLQDERIYFLDLIQKTHTDDGNGDGRITAAGLKYLDEVSLQSSHGVHPNRQDWSIKSVLRQSLAPSSILFLASRKQLTEKVNELFHRIEQAMHAVDGDAALEEIESEISELSDDYKLIKLLFPAVTWYREIMVRTLANSNGALTALAVIRYERQHGRLPETLHELVGEFLDKMPIDPSNGQPLRYQQTDDGFVIDSAGVHSEFRLPWRLDPLAAEQ